MKPRTVYTTVAAVLIACLVVGAFVAFRGPSRGDIAQKHTREGQSFLAAGQFKQARDEFVAATHFDPANDQAHLGMARAYFAEGMAEFQAKLRTMKAGASVSFGDVRASFMSANTSLRRVNPANHLLAAEAEEIRISMKRTLKDVSRFDNMGDSLD